MKFFKQTFEHVVKKIKDLKITPFNKTNYLLLFLLGISLLINTTFDLYTKDVISREIIYIISYHFIFISLGLIVLYNTNLYQNTLSTEIKIIGYIMGPLTILIMLISVFIEIYQINYDMNRYNEDKLAIVVEGRPINFTQLDINDGLIFLPGEIAYEYHGFYINSLPIKRNGVLRDIKQIELMHKKVQIKILPKSKIVIDVEKLYE